MAKVFKYLPYEKYTRIENDIFRIKKSRLSDGAKVLYGFIAGFQNGRNISDNFILESLEISDKSLKKYKKELKLLDLIYIVRINRTSYDLYIGYLDFPSTKVYEYWETINNAKGEPLSLQEIEERRKHLVAKPISKTELNELREKHNK